MWILWGFLAAGAGDMWLPSCCGFLPFFCRLTQHSVSIYVASSPSQTAADLLISPFLTRSSWAPHYPQGHPRSTPSSKTLLIRPRPSPLLLVPVHRAFYLGPRTFTQCGNHPGLQTLPSDLSPTSGSPLLSVTSGLNQERFHPPHLF